MRLCRRKADPTRLGADTLVSYTIEGPCTGPPAGEWEVRASGVAPAPVTEEVTPELEVGALSFPCNQRKNAAALKPPEVPLPVLRAPPPAAATGPWAGPTPII